MHTLSPAASASCSTLHAEPLVQPTRCAICGTLGQATELYPANFTPAALNADVFSARRLPDRLHYRLVCCDQCGLVRSDPIAQPEMLEQLYQRSEFTYSAELPYLRLTYRRYLDMALRHVREPRSLLEIGSGNGFFLEESLTAGLNDVWGVEPSEKAVAAVPDAIRSRLICSVMHAELFPPESFDVICLFQVFDHFPDPVELLAQCHGMLRPGGVVLALNHNVKAWSARLLGRRSPIIDIEHTYLYSLTTMARIFTRAGFEIAAAGKAWNSYPLHYLLRLMPMPAASKRLLLAAVRWTRLGKIPLRVPLGNLYQVARKPERRAGRR